MHQKNFYFCCFHEFLMTNQAEKENKVTFGLKSLSKINVKIQFLFRFYNYLQNIWDKL